MRKRIKSVLCALLTLLIPMASAETVVLPEQLMQVAAEAFSGDTSIVEVVLSEHARAIGPRAFSGCAQLGWITIPGTVETLGEGCLDGCAEDLLIRTEAGSAACDFARAYGIDYQAGTVYRALLIGQTYPEDDALALQGPENDIAVLSACLQHFSDTPYNTTVCRNLTSDGMLAAVADVFGSANDADVSLFYYSGHGVSSDDPQQQGALLGADGMGVVTASQLRTALDAVPGRKIVVIDACYSGALLTSRKRAARSTRGGDMALSTFEPVRANEFVDSFISAFSVKKRNSLAADGYYVLTAAAEDEESYEGSVEGTVMGLFTYNLTKGCGYSPDLVISDAMPADTNGNDVVTMQEAYQYTRKKLIIERQHVQTYPQDCVWFGIFRR